MGEIPKNTFPIDEKFIPKVLDGIKVFSFRNSPIELGEYKINNELTIEVFNFEKKVISFMNKYEIGETLHFFEDINLNYNAPYIGYEEFGFNSNIEMIEFYKKYFKSNTVFLISFRVKN